MKIGNSPFLIGDSGTTNFGYNEGDLYYTGFYNQDTAHSLSSNWRGAAGSLFTLSFWVYPYSLTNQDYIFNLRGGGGNKIAVRTLTALAEYNIIVYNSSATIILNLDTDSGALKSNEWTYHLISANTQGTTVWYWGNTSSIIKNSRNPDAKINDNYAATDQFFIDTQNGSVSKPNCVLFDVWYLHGTALNVASSTVRDKFWDGPNWVNLGHNGELPTGSSPDVFLKSNTTNYGNTQVTFSNSGTFIPKGRPTN